ncbi:MAG: hypothetical protein II697_06645, partial [Clostridia bacterium]|nr:hypothetical protein [Clostridia bacterium]
MKLFASTSDMTRVLSLCYEAPLEKTESAPDENTFTVDPTAPGHPILGFGGNLTDTEVYNLMRMSPGARDAALKKLFDPHKGAGLSVLRLPLGSSDWERNFDFYSYDDMPEGEKDWELKHFSVQREEERGYFSLLSRIHALYPQVLFVASVWAIPGWMKSTDNILGGIFLPQYTEVYARYLRMAVQAFSQRGIPLYAITIQNEPKSSDFPNACRQTPATRFTWRLERDVLIALRREFTQFGIATRIWAYDHNYDMVDIFVDPLLSDSAARAAFDGVAFHAYRGDPRVLEKYTRQYPELPLYSIEKTVSDPAGMDEVLRQLRYGARCYLLWSFLQDNYGGPHQLLGAPFKYLKETRMGMMYNMINAPDDVRTSASYGLFGIFGRFVRRDMRFCPSKYGHKKWLTHAAFADASGSITSILINQTDRAQSCTLRVGNKAQRLLIPALSVCACTIDPGEYDAKEAPLICAPEKQFTEKPAFDLAPTRLFFESAPAAGREARFCVELKNVGTAPTPENLTAAVDFLLDGDFRVARAYATIRPLQPGQSVTLKANTPLPDVSGTGVKTTWTAVQGTHDFMALLNTGNCFPPEQK